MINQERLIHTFLELVQIDSPSGEEELIAQFLVKKLTGFGFQVKRDDFGNVIATVGSGLPLLLSAHMDTVNPGYGVKPQIHDGRITSDGTTVLGGDDKAGIAAILEALMAVNEIGKLPSLQVVLTREEETGLVGARKLDYSLIKAKEGVVFDGEGPVNRVTNSAPSVLRISIEAMGRAAHAGVEPEKGISAIKPIAELAVRLPQGRLDLGTTANVGVVQGGSVFNAVPERALLQAEMRSRDSDTFLRLKKEIEQTITDTKAAYPEVEIVDRLEEQFQGYSLQEGHSSVKRVLEALSLIELKPQVGPTGGGSDTNIMYTHGIMAPVIGMADNNAHTVREYVDIDELTDVARFCEKLIQYYKN